MEISIINCLGQERIAGLKDIYHARLHMKLDLLIVVEVAGELSGEFEN
jgi:hypothetical protein